MNKAIKPKRWKDTHRTKLKIRLEKNETFLVFVKPEMTIAELRKLLELSTGIPYDLQRLTYLDEAELVDTMTIKENEIVPGGTLDLTVWFMWTEIIEKAIADEVNEVMAQGVDPSIPYTSPVVEYMDEDAKLEWIRKRAFVVLCIAAHREYLILFQKMLPLVPNINRKTPLGRTVLHIAASQGRSSVIKLLVDNGAKMNILDIDGLIPIEYAILFGRTDSERLISMLSWKDKQQKRAAVKKKPEPPPKPVKKKESLSDYIQLEPEIEPETEEIPADILPPVKAVEEEPKKPEPKDFDEVKTEGETLAKESTVQVEDDHSQPADYSKNPESFRRYLLTLKSESKRFGYAASIIDDHLRHLDEADDYYSFKRTELASEKEIFY